MDFKTESKSILFGIFKSETRTPIAAAKSNNQSVILSQLVKEFQDRARAEISKWRQAIDACNDINNPRWAPYQDLIDNLSTDGHLMACIQIRKAATMANRFVIRDADGNEQPDKTALLETEWFYRMLEDLLDTTFKGYTVLELVDPVTSSWQTWPRRNIIPQLRKVTFEAFGDNGILYDDPKYAKNVLEHRNHNIMGIMNDIIPQLIWKRNAQQTWADFSERFGIPMITGKTNKTDKPTLDKIQGQIDALGNAMAALLPEGTTIEIHDSSTKGDPHKIFMEQISVCNSEVSKRILGGTMITDPGSSRSQSEVHERTLNDKIAESDRKSIEFFVNGKLIPLLRANGINFGDGDVFVFDRTEEVGMKEHWDIISSALDKFNIPDTWVSKRFNFPIEGKKDPKTTPPVKKGISSNFQ